MFSSREMGSHFLYCGQVLCVNEQNGRVDRRDAYLYRLRADPGFILLLRWLEM